jgi:hypothetical protein
MVQGYKLFNLKPAFRGPADGTNPGIRKVLERSTGRNAVLSIPFVRVIKISTDRASVFFHFPFSC